MARRNTTIGGFSELWQRHENLYYGIFANALRLFKSTEEQLKDEDAISEALCVKLLEVCFEHPEKPEPPKWEAPIKPATNDELASWFITTTIKTVALCVSPHPTGIEWSFRYAIEAGVYNDNEFPKAVRLALIDAMTDLLVPVFVRDIQINAAGVVEPEVDDVYDEWEHAGLGVPLTFFKNLEKGLRQ